ncbi:MAG: MSCRAMM family adhesin SdrC [Planctomycetaceae bacterium]|nr:MSCRAMM family adhesin SdrC [Planctomycetaceae bacterium]
MYFYLFVFFLSSVVQVAVGFTLAMFLREWYLEDKKKQLEAKAAANQEGEADNIDADGADNIDEGGVRRVDESAAGDGNIESGLAAGGLQGDANQTAGNIAGNIDNNSQKNVSPDSESLSGELSAASGILTGGDKSAAASGAESGQTADSEIMAGDSEIGDGQVSGESSAFRVDEIIGGMLSESPDAIPTDISEQMNEFSSDIFIMGSPDAAEIPADFEPETNSPNDDFLSSVNNSQNDNFPDSTTTIDDLDNISLSAVDDFGGAAADDLVERSYYDKTFGASEITDNDFANMPKEDGEGAAGILGDISPIAVEVLGEDFDFGSLLAESKVVDTAVKKNTTETDSINNQTTTNSPQNGTSEPVPNPTTESESESKLKPDSDSTTESESKPDSDLTTETESESELKPDSDSTTETEPETKPDSDSATETETKPDSNLATDSDSTTETESETDSDSEVGAKLESELETESVLETESKSGANLESESESALDSESKSGSKLESDLDSKAGLGGGVFDMSPILVSMSAMGEEKFSERLQSAVPEFSFGMVERADVILSDAEQSFTEISPPIYTRKNKKSNPKNK